VLKNQTLHQTIIYESNLFLLCHKSKDNFLEIGVNKKMEQTSHKRNLCKAVENNFHILPSMTSEMILVMGPGQNFLTRVGSTIYVLGLNLKNLP